MKKGQLTRQYILETTAPIFNRHGYGNTTLDEIKAATGLQKGGIYGHFSSKDEIALEAFDYACHVVSQARLAKIQACETAYDKLIAYLESFLVGDPPIGGGCPVFNTAVENDDGHPELKKKAQAGYKRLTNQITELVNDAVREGSLRKDINTESTALFLLSTFEGALIGRNLMGRKALASEIMTELEAYLETKKPKRAKR